MCGMVTVVLSVAETAVAVVCNSQCVLYTLSYNDLQVYF